MSVGIARMKAKRLVDVAAGQARLRYITEVPGQQAVYLTKLAEASQYLAAHALDAQATPGPYLTAEAEATGSTALAVAQMVAYIAAAWNEQIGPAIESARLGGKAAVDAATGQDEAEILDAIESALAAAVAALNAL